MIAVYIDSGDRLGKLEIDVGDPIPKDTVFIDLYDPTNQEEEHIEKLLQINIPTRAEIDKIEVMSPFYKQGNAHYMTVTLLDRASKEDHPDSTAVTFILTSEYLVVLRYSTPWTLVSFISQAMRGLHQFDSSIAMLSGILEAFINKTAEALEGVGNELDGLLKTIFEKSNKEGIISSKKYNSVIRKIGHTGNLISKNRESLVSINRLIIYFGQIEGSSLAIKDVKLRYKFKNLSREVHSLGEYGNFLSQRNSFLLDATLGMIYVEQNMIIKVFTVASAVFMPATLIASIYGMNFKEMPELSWDFGYPMALAMIATSALFPYFFFKKKKWL